MRKIDLIYERSAFFCFAGVVVAKKKMIPIILEVNEITGIKRQRGQVLTKLARHIEMFIFKKADAIVTVSSFLKGEIARRGIDERKIYLVPNAVNEREFNPSIEGIQKKEKLGLIEKITLLFMGNFSKWDNVNFLLNCFRKLSLRNTALHLLIVGDGKERKKIINLINNYDLSDHVTLVGKIIRKEIPQYIAASNICIIPDSNPFGSPIVLFEYLGIGKPVVVPNLSPLQDVIVNGENGLLFEPKNETSFIDQVSMLVNNVDLRKKIGINAANTVIQNHLWKHNVGKTLVIYRKIINK